MTPNEKAKAGVISGYLTPEEQKAYMAEQRCFGCHVKGHRKQDCAKWKEKQQASTSPIAASPASKTPASLSTPSVAHLVPSLRQPQVMLDDKQEGIPTCLGLLGAYGSAKGHSFTILFDTGHRGIDATVKAVETFFYWPRLRRDVDAFVRECIICQKVKFDRQKAPVLLQPLPIQDKPWESIAMDFIFDLPRTQTGNDGIWTIICKFSKQAHFIPVKKKIKPDQMARLFMSNIFKYHGMPQSIVSDRDPRMSNGQSEEANSIVLDLLKCYVSEHKGKWEQYLPLVEYAYNNTVHSSTSKAPFEIVEGGKKVPPILHTKDKIFEADKYVQDMDEMYKKVKMALEKTQAKQKKAANRHRREVIFSLGDWVLLRFEKARLKLPESWKILNAFRMTLLRLYVGNMPEDMPAEDQPKPEELDEILIPEQILAHKERKVKGKVARRYLVKFRNYPPMDAKWMEESELAKSPTVLSLYLEAFGLRPTLTPSVSELHGLSV
ncbi:hypothetical protein L7F22_064767 [Adiantum nelumboides]|nr:hypothetical protein [Adiantum nelumboides]